jgi:hypothetical protein
MGPAQSALYYTPGGGIGNPNIARMWPYSIFFPKADCTSSTAKVADAFP